MFLLNLSLGQFLALLGSASAVLVALYLFDRSRRRQTVATLRFWVAAEQPAVAVRRRTIQQPLSLILQIISIALLLLAIAQLRFGSQAAIPFDHVLVLDTSAWMGARSPRGQGRTLMDDARARARSYVQALPAGDRVMIVRADAMPGAATPFESNRKKLEEAIAQSKPGSTALNLDQALEFARHIQTLSAARAGEIVFAGAGRISERESETESTPALKNLRVLTVPDAGENLGLRKIGLRKPPGQPDAWEIFVSVKNYGAKVHVVNLALQFGGAPAGTQQLTLPPGKEQEATFTYRTRAAGLLEARLLSRDVFPGDDRVVLELPRQKALAVVVYSDDPETLRPVLESDVRVSPVFRPTSQYSPKPEAALVVLDRFVPPLPPGVDAIWIDPPSNNTPIPVRARVQNARLTRWRIEHPLGAGLRTRDVNLETASVLATAADDVRIAECDSGPVIAARAGKTKTVVLGFHPTRTAMRYELATPLLFANILRWIAPDVFRRWELNGGTVGTVNVALDPDVKRDQVKVVLADGRPLPFTVLQNPGAAETLHFFSGAPGPVRVLTADRERVYSLTLPELGEVKWDSPKSARTGLPTFRETIAGAVDLWQALAVLGALGLLVEWFLFGRFARGAIRRQAQVRTMAAPAVAARKVAR